MLVQKVSTDLFCIIKWPCFNTKGWKLGFSGLEEAPRPEVWSHCHILSSNHRCITAQFDVSFHDVIVKNDHIN